MSVTMAEYEASDPMTQALRIRSLLADRMICPLCQRVGKWYYSYHDGGRGDNSVRCSLHEITPIPGPASLANWRKVSQLY